MWGGASSERKSSRLARDFDVDNLHDQLDKLRNYAEELSRSASHDASRGLGTARRGLGTARAMASGAAHDAEGKVKDHLAISLVLSLGLGMLVGYFIHRGGSK